MGHLEEMKCFGSLEYSGMNFLVTLEEVDCSVAFVDRSFWDIRTAEIFGVAKGVDNS